MSGKPMTRQRYMESAITRFWSKVDRRGPDDCWLWEGTKAMPNPAGMVYGSFGLHDNGKGISYRAHRFAWMLANGQIPEGMVIMHNCDVPLCVNPAHLSCGTQFENCQDVVKRGRSNLGERHGCAKLTERDVMAIRQSDKPDRELAKQYDAHPTTITAARTGKNWGHLPMPERTSEKQRQ